MMKSDEFVDYLKTQFNDIKFYKGTINKKDTQCVGVYIRGSARSNIAIGGKDNTSYGTLPITLLVHWTENSDMCEQKSIEIYNHMLGLSNFSIGNRNISYIELLDPCPISVDRDSNNIAEMVIRINIIYER